jgi:hydrogenase maturation protein HypF
MLTVESKTRLRLRVQGVVQGVGFRPFVYTLAQRCGLTGFVGNDSSGVSIEVEGTPAALHAFQTELPNNPPPLAHIESIAVEALPVQHGTHFEIVHSSTSTHANTLITPDICICDACLRELFDPQNRRYRYPFINCTHCGPRFTITRDMPYDRPLTTMAAFVMCGQCQAEYDNPLDRRFHAQPNACPQCGPQVWLEVVTSQLSVSRIKGDEALKGAQQLLKAGKIVAVKGVGGFHLACDAMNDAALRTLRERKGRVDKPFAVMARDLESVRRFAEVSPAEAAMLNSRERPIVLLRKREGALSELVAPRNPSVGVLLPYTPLHYLLLEDTPLVMTSGNFSGEPIITDNDEARAGLAPLADAFLLHDRDIYVPCDDTVVRVFESKELPVRRSRGYAPFPVKLPIGVPCVLAVGAELKNTFCLTKADHAFISQHIGDLENLETLNALTQGAQHFKTIFRAEPQAIIADLHPRYLSAQWAEQEAQALGIPLLKVQHHHAHIAAVMAEHGLSGDEPLIGICFDGTGYGTDGAIWGGEILIADYRGFRRAAHLKYVPLAGGDSAVKHPSRLALAYLWAAGVTWDEALPPVAANNAQERRVIQRQLATGFGCVPTSSMGRLFDAVAALAGVRQTITYEAQAAMELEGMCAENTIESQGRKAYIFGIEQDVPFIIDTAPLIRAIAEDVQSGISASVISAKFHHAVVDMLIAVAGRLRDTEHLNRVALSGGVFQNVRLLSAAVERLRSIGFDVLTHRHVPPNDGGLALGQAMIGVYSLQSM